ncbi:g8970 [Coccomyxa elongata]
MGVQSDVPILPAYSSTKVRFGEFHHKKQTLGYEKGYAVRALLPKSSSNVASQQSYPFTAFQSTSEQGDFAALSHDAKSKVPKWVEYDRKVLRWFAYFEEVVPESAEEQYRIRRVTILYYLEDDTLEVTEPKQENSGILQVLRFYIVWDDRASLYGDRRPYKLHYFVEDGTCEILEHHDRNSGRDPFPVFLRRGLLPKNGEAFKHGFAPERSMCYGPSDLRMGTCIAVYGRMFYIYDCDDFTRKWLKENMGSSDEELCAVDITEPVPPPPAKQLPAYNGFGSPEDSAQNCTSLIPRPPRKDFYKLMNKDKAVLRFVCRLVEASGAPKNLIDGLITDVDLHVGAIIPILQRKFELLDADEFTLQYMENNRKVYVMADADKALKALATAGKAVHSRIPSHGLNFGSHRSLRFGTEANISAGPPAQIDKPITEALREVEPLVGLEGYGNSTVKNMGASMAPLASPSPSIAKQAKNYTLTRDMILAVAPEGPVMVTWANFHYLDFVLNWVAHVDALGIKPLVGSMDDKILQALVDRGVHTFAMRSGLSEDDFGWGSASFHKMGREKIQLIYTFTKMGFDILVADVDTVWLKNPLPYLARYPDADILTSSDHLMNTTADDGLEKFPEAGSAANIGIMLVRKGALALAKEWNEVLLADDKVWDQNAFNDLFRQNLKLDGPESASRIFRGYDGKLRLGILPVALFASGHTYFVQRLHEQMGLDVYAVHATFQYSGTPGKRHRMRERLLWLADPPEYYNPPGGLLTFDLQLGDLVNKSVPVNGGVAAEDYSGHFDLVNAQLQQIRNALAVATALNRTLVFPALWCGADRWWAPHNGIIPGSGLQLPFQCPLDHVLDLEQMTKEFPEAEFGPGISFREYSLLDNPKANIQRADIVNVTICQVKGGQVCTLQKAQAKAVTLPANPEHSSLMEALEPYKKKRVLHFPDMRLAYSNFPSKEHRKRYELRTNLYTSLWCCVDKHPGHVWYDMWWDVIPHTDRHSRIQTGPWVPITGP